MGLKERVIELEEALEKFGQHKEMCHWLYFITEICDCGLHHAQRKEEDNGQLGTQIKNDEL